MIIIFAILLALGILFLSTPMTIARVIASWAKFVFTNLFPKQTPTPKVVDALHLIENNPAEYVLRFSHQLAIIRITGLVALFISLSGVCIMIMG